MQILKGIKLCECVMVLNNLQALTERSLSIAEYEMSPKMTDLFLSL